MFPASEERLVGGPEFDHLLRLWFRHYKQEFWFEEKPDVRIW